MSQIIIDLDGSSIVLKEAAAMLLRLSGYDIVISAQGENFTQEELAESDIIVAEAAIAVATEAVALADAPDNPFAANPVGEQVVPAVVKHQSALEGLDSAGHRWDKRIHSSGKTTVANGTWKMKKGVEKALVDQVLAEQHHAPVLVDTVAHPTVVETPVVEQQTVATVIEQPTLATQIAVLTWPIVLQRVTIAQNNGTLNHAAKDKFLEVNGITGGFPLISTRPDLFESFLIAAGA